MSQRHDFAQPEPERAGIDALAGAFVAHPGVRHVKVEDGSGHRLGRSFGVKLWPTLVFLLDGKEVERLVRPKEEAAVRAAFEKIDLAA
jgi:thioredoxin 1